jgi:hypothetical protein
MLRPAPVIPEPVKLPSHREAERKIQRLEGTRVYAEDAIVIKHAGKGRATIH